MLQMITVIAVKLRLVAVKLRLVAVKLRLKEESFPYYSCFQLFVVANLKWH